jgi:hypothetical protein
LCITFRFSARRNNGSWLGGVGVKGDNFERTNFETQLTHAVMFA